MAFARASLGLAAAFLGSIASTPRRVARLATPATLLVLGTLAALLPITAGAAGAGGDKIYWGNESGSVRSGDLGGGGAADVFGGAYPCGVALDPAAGKIYWASWSNQAIQVGNLDGSGTASNLFSINSESGNNLCGVAIDPAAGRIYWANFSSNTIRVGNLNGLGSASTLFTEPAGSAPSGVAIDPAGGKIYWTNQFTDQVRVGNLNGSGTASTLFGSDATVPTVERNPIGVAVDPAAGKIYWTDLGNCCSGPGQVRVGNLNGSGTPSTLFDGEGGPGGLAIDPGANKIYWATFGPGVIRVGNLDGTGASTLFGGENSSLFAALLRAPAGTGLPTISGGGNVGETLTCSQGSWAPDLLGAFLFRAPRSFAYQWRSDGSDIVGANSSQFTPAGPGAYSCRVTATNHAGSASQTSETFTLKPTLGLKKFYDANANGRFDESETALAGWRIQIATSYYLTPTTLKLDPANYLVSESDPLQTNWRHTTASSAQVSLGAHDQVSVEFGNVCVGGGGALTAGFWTNKNGQALFGADDLALMVSLNLPNADGSPFNPASYSAFRDWLGKATSTNMAYGLAAQLATMELNVLNGKVGSGSLIYAPGTTSANAAGFATVNAVMAEANTELGLHGLTKGGSPFRAYQTVLKDALFNANGNTTFVQATPCPFSFG
jgi:DNA-binding beta-propeller fold protein YncE